TRSRAVITEMTPYEVDRVLQNAASRLVSTANTEDSVSTQSSAPEYGDNNNGNENNNDNENTLNKPKDSRHLPTSLSSTNVQNEGSAEVNTSNKPPLSRANSFMTDTTEYLVSHPCSRYNSDEEADHHYYQHHHHHPSHH